MFYRFCFFSGYCFRNGFEWCFRGDGFELLFGLSWVLLACCWSLLVGLAVISGLVLGAPADFWGVKVLKTLARCSQIEVKVMSN